VSVRYYTVFCMATGYCREEKVFCPDNCDLATMLKSLATRYGDRMEQIVSGMLTGAHPTFWAIVNGTRVKGSDYFRPLNDGDVVVLTTPLLVGG